MSYYAKRTVVEKKGLQPKASKLVVSKFMKGPDDGMISRKAAKALIRESYENGSRRGFLNAIHRDSKPSKGYRRSRY